MDMVIWSANLNLNQNSSKKISLNLNQNSSKKISLNLNQNSSKKINLNLNQNSSKINTWIPTKKMCSRW